jgi:hypothetical protein
MTRGLDFLRSVLNYVRVQFHRLNSRTLAVTVDKVKKFLDVGLSIPTAIKEALPMSVGAFADKYDIPQTLVSETINGGRRASEKLLAALIAELGGTEAEWRELLWLAGKPESSTAA